MYGAQAVEMIFQDMYKFENDVEMYGAQAYPRIHLSFPRFENDVEMYGAQASLISTQLFL